MWRFVPDHLFYLRKKAYLYLRKLYIKYEIWYINDNLRRKHFLLNCRQVMSNAQQQRWWYTSPWRWLEKTEHWILARQRPLFLLQDLFIASKHLHNSKSRCCSLLIWIDSLQHFLASFNFKTAIVQPLDSCSSSRLLQGHFITEFQPDRQTQATDHGSSTTLHHCKCDIT